MNNLERIYEKFLEVSEKFFQHQVLPVQRRTPKIAILGLNPHCGDKGVIGQKDDTIIRPVVQDLFEQGILVFGRIVRIVFSQGSAPSLMPS